MTQENNFLYLRQIYSLFYRFVLTVHFIGHRFLGMDYPVCISIPEQCIAPNDGEKYIKHVEFRGNDDSLYHFEYKKMEKTMLFKYWIECQQLENNHAERLMSVTFKPVTLKDELAINFCKDVLMRGIFCDGKKYRFLGHSEFQLREKNCYLMSASEEEIYNILEKFGEFSKIANQGKRARSIAMLFTKSDYSIKQSGEIKVNVMQDAKARTPCDCGFMSQQFSSKVKELLNLVASPSAVLVLYQGFQGLLILNNDLKDGPEIQLHPSMQKFVIPGAMDNAISEICFLEHSSPHVIGYLDSKMVMLLSSRGVSKEYLKKLQTRYFDLLKKMTKDNAFADYFLHLTGKHERVTGCEGRRVYSLQQGEIEKMKCDVQNSQQEAQARTRILVPQARVVFGVCDPHNSLKCGECYFDPTLLHDDKEEFLGEKRIVVARSPCYHPGDILVLELAHRKPGYEHLKDCLVLPLKGPFPHTFVYSSDSSRGCMFFVSWNQNLVPKVDVNNFFLSATSDKDSQVKGNTENTIKEHRKEMLEYFATYKEDVRDRIDDIYMKAATAAGPSSRDCEKLSMMIHQEASLTVDRSALEKQLDELEKEPGEPASSHELSLSEEPTESTALLNEDGSNEAETQSRRKSAVISTVCCLSSWLSLWCASGKAQTFPVPGFEVWPEFDERTEEFLKEMKQENREGNI